MCQGCLQDMFGALTKRGSLAENVPSGSGIADQQPNFSGKAVDQWSESESHVIPSDFEKMNTDLSCQHLPTILL